jgi:restriction endonuclease S subunit
VESDELLSEYLEILIKDSRFNAYVATKANVGNGVRMNFTFEDMGNWEIPLPSVDEQIKFITKSKTYVEIINNMRSILKNINYSDFIEIQCGSLYKLGDVISLEYGKSLPDNERISGNIPVYGSNGIIGYHNKSLVEGKGIIFGRKGSAGRISWSECAFWVIDTAFYVKLCNDNFDMKYIYYLLNDINLEKLVLDAVKPGINRNDVYNINVSIPDKKEQIKIVEKLEETKKYIDNTANNIKQYEFKLTLLLSQIWGEEE